MGPYMCKCVVPVIRYYKQEVLDFFHVISINVFLHVSYQPESIPKTSIHHSSLLALL